MLKQAIRRHIVGSGLLWLALTLTALTANAQEAAKLEEVSQDKKAKVETKPASRSSHVVDHERVRSGLLQLMRSRGVRNPLLVVDGWVVRPPVQLHVRQYNIECVELRPGRLAVLDYARSPTEMGTDGVLLIWTRDSRGPKPKNCKIPY